MILIFFIGVHDFINPTALIFRLQGTTYFQQEHWLQQDNIGIMASLLNTRTLPSSACLLYHRLLGYTGKKMRHAKNRTALCYL